MKNTESPLDINFISQLIQENINIPVFMWKKGELIKGFNPSSRKHPLFEIKTIHQKIINQTVHNTEKPIIKTTNQTEYYIHLNLKMRVTDNLDFLLGPVLLTSIDDHQFHNLIKERKVPFRLKEALKSYFDSLPIYSLNKLKSIGQLLYYLVTHVPIDSEEIIITDQLTEGLSDFKENVDFQMTVTRSQEKLHHDNNHENKLRQLVKEGRYEEIKQFGTSSPPFQNYGTVANHPIRNEKNLAITTVALASRAAMEGGLNTEVAYSLSDLFIQKIESDDQLYNFLSYAYEIYYEYAYRVAEAKNKNYTKPIQDVQDYIYNNLYKKINLNMLADYVYLNPKYLSRLFKEEVGLSISEYILMEKVKESKNWLKSSNLSIAEISSQVNFYDQSHFSRVFKKIVGKTPTEYRKKHK